MVFIEKELKILNINPIALIAKLESLWATKKYDSSLYDVYFDTPSDDFGAQRKNVRIRFSNGGECITLKHRLQSDEYKAAIEHEYDVSWHDAIDTLEQQWLKPKRSKYKRRISYQLDDMLFDMDLYPGIPALLEIEADSIQRIRKGIRLVWLEQKNTTTCGARGLFKRYERQLNRFAN